MNLRNCFQEVTKSKVADLLNMAASADSDSTTFATPSNTQQKRVVAQKFNTESYESPEKMIQVYTTKQAEDK